MTAETDFPVIKLAQYLSGLTAPQDVWTETAQALVGFFGADLVAVAERSPEGPRLQGWTFSDRVPHRPLDGPDADEAVAEVLESGFLCTRLFQDPAPLSVVFLPVSREALVSAVMVVGFARLDPLPKTALNAYLAVAGLVGTTASRLASARELREHREHLEELVSKRTGELMQVNETLLLEVDRRERSEAIIQARLRLSEFGYSHSLRELLTRTLDEAQALTGSTRGFFHLLEPDERTLALQVWSHGATLTPTATEGEAGEDIPTEKTDVWAECLGRRQPVLRNSDATRPGPAPGVRELAVPVFEGEAIVCVLGVGDRAGDYAEHDVEAVSRLAKMAWDLVTARRARDQNAALEHQLLQAQKLESVGRLAGGVAHDFNNMLGAILGHLELVMDQVDPGLPIHEDLLEIKKAAQRSADLTRQLLAFAREQTAARQVLDLNATVEGMLKMLQRFIGEHLRLDWTPAPAVWPICFDPSQVDQILANLCINARDAISGTGTIRIETANATVDERASAARPGSVPGDYVRLVVADDGCGMSQETLARIFEPFFTTKEVGSGTGLGLATVYGIVQQNHGFIEVQSEPGRGTTFSLHLPRHTGSRGDDALRARAPSVSPTSRGAETILLVEDEPAILRMTTRLLEQQGFEVLGASAPAEAIRKAREHAGDIDLLMTDVVMPEMNGRELAEQLLATCPGLKRLYMSGYTADVIAHHGVLDEGVHFLQKPFSKAEVTAKVRAALDAKAGGEDPSSRAG
jgi:signal transduction histidine kinase/ActR/RegA family two-component response regulator